MQNQGMTSNHAIKVLERQVLRAQGKKIKDALNMLIRVLEESIRILDFFISQCMASKPSYLFSF